MKTNSKLQAANTRTNRRVGGSQERSSWLENAWYLALQPYLTQAQQPDVELVWDDVCHPALASANLVFSSMRLHSPVPVKGPTGAVSILKICAVGTGSVRGEWWIHCSPTGHQENGVCVASLDSPVILCVSCHQAWSSIWHSCPPPQHLPHRFLAALAEMMHHAWLQHGLGMPWLCPVGTCLDFQRTPPSLSLSYGDSLAGLGGFGISCTINFLSWEVCARSLAPGNLLLKLCSLNSSGPRGTQKTFSCTLPSSGTFSSRGASLWCCLSG